MGELGRRVAGWPRFARLWSFYISDCMRLSSGLYQGMASAGFSQAKAMP
jgi:hypothetical protein